MSDRFYVNGVQIFGNNEMFNNTYTELKRQGAKWKDGTLKPCRVMKDNTTLRSKKENLEKENDRLKAEIENLQSDKNALAHSVVSLGNIIREKEELWGELEKRFVTVEKICDVEEKAKCPMFPEFCEGSCKERIDLVALLDKACEGGKVC